MINARQLTRRGMLLLAVAGLAPSLTRDVEAAQVEAGEESERHGMSAFGDLKYLPDFKHFDYVNPNAPKGGVFSHIGATRAFNQNFLTFNSLNNFILKGDGAQGNGAHLCKPDGTRSGRTRRAVRPRCARGAHIRGWAELPLSDAARHHLP
jgi:ABC-type oligopeptide transport system substrate-binding subunit